MAGERKKSKQNSDAAAQAVATINKEIRDQLRHGSLPGSAKTPAASRSSSKVSLERHARDKTPASPWYGGSWKAKASPVARIAHESISVAGGATSESNNDTIATSPTSYMNSGLKKPSKSDPILAQATKVNASRSNDNFSNVVDTNGSGQVDQDIDVAEKPQIPTDAATDQLPDNASTNERAPQPPGGWFGWWSRPDGYANSEIDVQVGETIKKTALAKLDDATTVTTPQKFNSAPPSPGRIKSNESARAQVHPERRSAEIEKFPRDTPSRSWFRLWSASQNQQQQQQDQQEQQEQQQQQQQHHQVRTNSDTPQMAPKPSKVDSVTATTNERPKTPQRDEFDVRSPLKPAANTPSKPSSGWAFWSSDKKDPSSQKTGRTQKHLGELAVADTPSQSHPEAAQFNEQQGRRPSSKQSTISRDNPENKGTSTASLTNLMDVSAPPPSATTKHRSKSEAARLAQATQALQNKLKGPPNYVLPSFGSTYPHAYIPSYLERIGQYLASSLRITDTVTTPKHVCVSPTLPKVKNAIAIGVHGYFPAPIIQKVLGQPTGTSIRFANYAADAIRWWTEQHQPETPCEIEQIALEGEGLIADRVNTLWKLLLNWLSHLRKADLILVACHSQGVPVSAMLVAKLIELGCLGNHVKIGICAMAGVNLGPFIDFKSKFFGGSAAELFEFCRPNSDVSHEYASSLDVILRHGVRITYVGSLDDQLVSLESALFVNLSHPYVQRAVFVDSRHHALDFIARLVAFALKLRNLGVSDHGLIRELSAPLAGSIYSGEGHSRVYDDEAVYRLALEFTLNATDIDPRTYVFPDGAIATSTASSAPNERNKQRDNGGIPSSTSIANNIRRGNTSASQRPGVAPVLADYQGPASGTNSNPYYLPWALRGILEEPTVKKTMQHEVMELIRLFEEWKPVTKPLKDVRFRLEAVKSATRI